MFKFLKDKLKGVVDSMKKEVEEEVEVEEKVIEVLKPKKETKKEALKKEKKEEKKEEVPKKEEKKETSKKEVQKKAPKEDKQEEKEEKEIKGVKITYFVHGTTTDNEKKLATGQEQGELSDLGTQQSKDLPAQVKDDSFEIIFTSDLDRAIDSAGLAFPNYKIKQDKRLREMDYGDFTQKPSKEFKKDIINHLDKPLPNGESLREVEKRIAEFLNHIYNKYQGKHIAIVAHQYPQLAIEVLLQGKTWEQAIEDDWRLKKEWQPGWIYNLEKEVEVPEFKITKKGFLGRIFGKKQDDEEVVEEKKDAVEKPVKEETTKSKDELQKEVKEEEIEEEIKKEVKKTEESVEEELNELDEEIEEMQSNEVASTPKPKVLSEVKAEISEEIETEDAPEEKKGFFGRVTERFTTFNLSEDKFEDLFWNLEMVLLENNVAVEVIEKIKHDLKEELCTGKVSKKGIETVIKDSLKKSIEEVLDIDQIDIFKEVEKKKPYIITFIGVNGSGKTTHMAKLAKQFLDKGKTVVFAAADTFRAAAIQQLEEHANALGIKMIKHDYNADPAAVAYDAIEHAKAKGIDIVMIDTAGRLHSNTNLMQELKKLIKVNNPDFKIFVGESITGNDCVEQATVYNQEVGIDGIILSKADVDEKGGAAISVSYVTKKPILFIGTGQTYDDLKVFDKELVLKSLDLE